MNKTLLVMAAGLGKRFGGGGQKQITGLGPSGEILMEYSIHDARLAGFDHFAFVIAPAMADFFPEFISQRLGIDGLKFAVQSNENLPDGFTAPAEREKPYGTVSAVLAAADIIDEPFAVINADDYYGREAFFDLAAAMDSLADSGEACMLTYPIASTLSLTGGVTRGICRVSDGCLTGLDETRGVTLNADGAACCGDRIFPADTPVSMNIFGFTPWIFGVMRERFSSFLSQLSAEDALTAEYPIPVMLDSLIAEGGFKLKATPTLSQWFGVTFREDIDDVRAKLAAIDGMYK